MYEPNPQIPDLDPLFAQAPAIRVSEAHLRWSDWERHSRRQEAAMKFGGLAGTVVLSGSLGPFLPYLCLGAIINVGQETTFGLGRFRLEIL